MNFRPACLMQLAEPVVTGKRVWVVGPMHGFSRVLCYQFLSCWKNRILRHAFATGTCAVPQRLYVTISAPMQLRTLPWPLKLHSPTFPVCSPGTWQNTIACLRCSHEPSCTALAVTHWVEVTHRQTKFGVRGKAPGGCVQGEGGRLERILHRARQCIN